MNLYEIFLICLLLLAYLIYVNTHKAGVKTKYDIENNGHNKMKEQYRIVFFFKF